MNTKMTAIRQLREKTGAGMMDCKRALDSTGGDVERAVEALKEQGLMQLRKREDRETKEGRIFVKVEGPEGVMLKLSCETDFVAMNSDFIALGEDCMRIAFEEKKERADEELDLRIQEAAARIKENIVPARLQTISAGDGEALKSYLHGEGRIAVIVRLKTTSTAVRNTTEYQQLENDIALQITADAPRFLSFRDVPQEYLAEKEGEFLEEARGLDKPEDMIPGIVQGKLQKHLSRICLLEQPFVKDESITVRELIRNVSAGLETEIEVTGFVYDKVEGNRCAVVRALI